MHIKIKANNIKCRYQTKDEQNKTQSAHCQFTVSLSGHDFFASTTHRADHSVT